MIAICPPFCQNDHSREPADVHAGQIVLSANAELIITDTPAGRTLDLIGEPSTIAAEGAISLSPAAAAVLASVLTDLAA